MIVDGAHAFAQFPFKQADLDCDYYGTSLHKWVLAPIGTGMLYVKRNKIEKIWPMMPAGPNMNANIRKFEEIGTHPASQRNAITEALNFHESIGAERKAERFRYLRKRWSNRLRELPGVKILNSEDPEQSCGIGFISVDGIRCSQALGLSLGEASHLDGRDCHPRRVSGPAHHSQRLHHSRRSGYVYGRDVTKIIDRDPFQTPEAASPTQPFAAPRRRPSVQVLTIVSCGVTSLPGNAP